jgi:hypothetical protein
MGQHTEFEEFLSIRAKPDNVTKGYHQNDKTGGLYDMVVLHISNLLIKQMDKYIFDFDLVPLW